MIIMALLANAMQGQVMYPGDTNNDGVANYLDLLPIGIAFGIEGEPRPGASEGWFAQPFFPWDYNLPTTPWVNGGYINANGDAIIDTLDLDAIIANYDLLQDTAMPMPWLHNLPCFTCPQPEFLITYDKDSVKVNEPFQAFISVRYPGPVPVEQGALGVAMELSYDPELVVEEAVEITPNTDEAALMFVTATSIDAFGYRLPAPGRMQISAAGRGQNAFFKDSTLVATVSFIVIDDIQRDTVFRSFKLNVESLLFLNVFEELLNPILLNPDSVVLYQPLDPVSEAPVQEMLEAFPNPAGKWLRVRADRVTDLPYLRLWNVRGVMVREIEPATGREWTIPLEGIPNGVYWLETYLNGMPWIDKILVQN